MDEIRQNIFNSLNLSHHYDAEIERRVNQLIERGEVSQADGSIMLQQLLSVSSRQGEVIENIEGRIVDFLEQRQIPTKKDMRSLLQKIDELSKRVEALNYPNTKET